MQLKALDIVGFKSFPDRIQLQFDKGITAVVGPNGSGKSNISDAVRWVLGEQSGKTLRSGKMEEVIFTGTQQRKPMGYASVSLTIDNRDRRLPVESDEVTVSRKIFRSGESEYRLNGASVRLRDINELFMDTGLGRDGYSIIGQGRIAEIVGAKSAQRREIFEEAAGISKFRYRKEQAEKRLLQAEENLLRLKDILSELEGRVEPLRLQSQKAQEYLQLASRRRKLEISLWLLSAVRLREQLRTQEDKLLLAQGDREDLQKNLETIEAKTAEIYEAIRRCDTETEDRRQEVGALHALEAQHSSRIAVLHNDMEHNKETILRLQENMATHALGKARIQEQLDEISDRNQEREQELLVLRGRQEALAAESAKEENTAQELAGIQASLIEERAALLHEISNEKLLGASSAARMEQLRQSEQDIQAQTAETQAALEECERQRQQITALLQTIEEQTVSQQNVQKGYLMKHKAVSSRLAELKEEQQEQDAQQKGYLQKARLIRDMEKNMEGFQQSVRFIMNQAQSGNLRGIEGPVSRLIAVESRYACAIEVALGGAMQNLVVTTDAAAKVAIEALKRSRAGRATFLPMSVIRPRRLEETGLDGCEGFVAVADALVSCEEKYRAVIGNLLGKIVVAEDMDCAVAIAKRYGYRFRVVTLDGQVVNPGGSMTGGSLSHGAGLLSRASEIEKLEAQARAVEKKLEENAAAIKSAGEDLACLNARLTALDADARTMGEDRIRYEAEQKRLDMQQDSLLRQKEEAARRAEDARRKIAQLTDQGGSSEEKLRRLTEAQEALEGRLAELKERQEKAAEDKAAHAEIRNALAIESLTLEKDIEAGKQLADQLKEQQLESGTRSEELRAQAESLERQNIRLKEEIGETEAQIVTVGERAALCTQKVTELIDRKTELERQSAQSRQKERELHAKGESIVRELARLEERRDAVQNEYHALVSRLYDEYELTLTQAEEERLPLEDPTAAGRELAALKNKIKALGNVNVAAIEEYQEVNGRYQFLKGQLADVEHSRAELYRLITDLAGEMKEIFVRNFREIDRHFGQIFTELFGGGNARLLLTEPENVLESGIEIYVQPPGKIIKNLAALSGGEQAFVAIAIYFAILKVRPSPFCLLDEIEAALDDVNVVKYAGYLRRLAGHTQFIAISHRRGTMEEADVLYGVTMQEEGVSKLLRLDVSELESKLGMK
ncbi:MAG: chromosome segregation protein SMC [Provencibacterium sp.]|jgi:chromosome segregation protein|nr:chromosome segregation protein SMC [Provencibacterium sp.]